MKRLMAILLIPATASCQKSAVGSVEPWACQGSEVCVSAAADSEVLILQVVNKSPNEIYVPPLYGVGNASSLARFDINPIAYKRDLKIRTDGIPLSASAEKVILVPDAWLGVSLSMLEVKQIYDLRPGCQLVSIQYKINDANGVGFYAGIIDDKEIEVCIPE